MNKKEALQILNQRSGDNFLACPFCGDVQEKPYLTFNKGFNEDVHFVVQCTNCGCSLACALTRQKKRLMDGTVEQ
jgi:transcription elongation factor Elf1